MGRRAVGRGLRDLRAAAHARAGGRAARHRRAGIYFANGATAILDRVRTSAPTSTASTGGCRIDEARARLGDARAVQGNLDPALLLGPASELERRAATSCGAAAAGLTVEERRLVVALFGRVDLVGQSLVRAREGVRPRQLLERDVHSSDVRREDLLDRGVGQEVSVGRERHVANGPTPVDLVDEVEQARVHERLAPAGERDRFGRIEPIQHLGESVPGHVDLGDFEESQPGTHVAIEIAAIRHLELHLAGRGCAGVHARDARASWPDGRASARASRSALSELGRCVPWPSLGPPRASTGTISRAGPPNAESALSMARAIRGARTRAPTRALVTNSLIERIRRSSPTNVVAPPVEAAHALVLQLAELGLGEVLVPELDLEALARILGELLPVVVRDDPVPQHALVESGLRIRGQDRELGVVGLERLRDVVDRVEHLLFGLGRDPDNRISVLSGSPRLGSS